VPALFGWPVLDITVGFAMLSMLVELDSHKLYFPKRLQQPKLLLGLWFFCVFSHVPHTYFQGMLDSWEEPAKICFFTLLLFIVIDSPAKLRHVARLFVFMAVMMSIHALMQQKLGYGFAGFRPMYVPKPDGSIQIRSWFFGIFEDPNEMAQMIVASMPFTFVMFKKSNFFTWSIAMGLCVFLYFGMASGHSRGSLIGLGAALAMLVVMKLPAHWMPRVMPLGLLAALAACPGMTRALDMSARERIVFWGLGNQAFKSSIVNMLTGLGYGMFWSVTKKGRAAHNAFVNCYCEIGYLGYCFWFGLIILGILGAWRVRVEMARRRYDAEADYLWRFSGYIIIAMVAFSASSYFLSRTFIYPFFFLMALAGVTPVIADNMLEEDAQVYLFPSNRDTFILCAAGGFFSIIYIYISIRLMNLGL
jgi:hypothetical protein